MMKSFFEEGAEFDKNMGKLAEYRISIGKDLELMGITLSSITKIADLLSKDTQTESNRITSKVNALVEVGNEYDKELRGHFKDMMMIAFQRFQNKNLVQEEKINFLNEQLDIYKGLQKQNNGSVAEVKIEYLQKENTKLENEVKERKDEYKELKVNYKELKDKYKKLEDEHKNLKNQMSNDISFIEKK